MPIKLPNASGRQIESKSSLKAMPITISLGISNGPGDGIMKEEISGRADESIVFSKTIGKEPHLFVIR
jgi:hypothetical protein